MKKQKKKKETGGIKIMEICNGTYCVYIHINKINSKIYVGQTVFGDNPEKRWRNGDGYEGCTIFYKAIQKYGWYGFDHEIIASNLTKDEANNFEGLLIQKLDATNQKYGYNIKLGGDNYEWSDISKLKMEKSHRETIRAKHKIASEENLNKRFEKGDPTVRKCARCGVLFETKCRHKKSGEKRSMKQDYNKRMPRICPDCHNDDINKPKNVVKTCMDCGIEFVCSVFATMKIRCDECQKNANSQSNKKRQQRYYSSHKNCH